MLGDLELENVTEAVRTGWISSAGGFIPAFEEAWAARCERRHGIAVSNGTAALHVASAALDLAEGDEVIIPTFTIISCASAVLATGARPVLVDADERTWCMDVNAVADRIGPRTRAIMPVHIYGHPVDMDPLLALVEKHGLAVLEDAAEAHGALYRSDGRWRPCGSFGELSAFSFYANKPVTTGEGGMVLTDDDALAERCRALRNLCFQPGRRFVHEEIGGNFRLTNVQAAIGVAQVGRIDEVVERKRAIAHRYLELLADVPGLQLPVEEEWGRSVFWMVGIVVAEETGLDAAALAERLEQRGIETRPFFVGMHEQPVLRRMGLFEGERYPVADRLARQGLYLPSGVGLTDVQVERVCEALAEALS